MNITQAELKNYLTLDNETFTFYWKQKLNRRIVVGSKAGYVRKDGYKIIAINKIDYYEHTLVYLYLTGIYPDYLDHIDNNPSNNNISNLRKCSHQQNMFNQKKSTVNTSGIKGVTWLEKTTRYMVNLKCGEVRISKHFSVFKYKTKEIALEKAVSYLEIIRNNLHLEYANHG
jgi:hypothetical protein